MVTSAAPSSAIVSCSVEPDSQEAREYFVSVRDAGKVGFLLGPYATHAEALRNVERGKELGEKANSWAVFYAFGTCSAPMGHVKNTVFGV